MKKIILKITAVGAAITLLVLMSGCTNPIKREINKTKPNHTPNIEARG